MKIEKEVVDYQEIVKNLIGDSCVSLGCEVRPLKSGQTGYRKRKSMI
jgi:hypothetical protein